MSAIHISQVAAFSRAHSVFLNPRIKGTKIACPQFSGGRKDRFDCIRTSPILTKLSHCSVDRAWWPAKMASIELWISIPWCYAHSLRAHMHFKHLWHAQMEKSLPGTTHMQHQLTSGVLMHCSTTQTVDRICQTRMLLNN